MNEYDGFWASFEEGYMAKLSIAAGGLRFNLGLVMREAPLHAAARG